MNINSKEMHYSELTPLLVGKIYWKVKSQWIGFCQKKIFGLKKD